MKRHAEENLGLNNVMVGEPKTFISDRSDSEGWVTVFNTKSGFDKTQDGFKTLMWELVNEDDPIEKKETSAWWLANRLFYGTCTISMTF